MRETSGQGRSGGPVACPCIGSVGLLSLPAGAGRKRAGQNALAGASSRRQDLCLTAHPGQRPDA